MLKISDVAAGKQKTLTIKKTKKCQKLVKMSSAIKEDGLEK